MWDTAKWTALWWTSPNNRFSQYKITCSKIVWCHRNISRLRQRRRRWRRRGQSPCRWSKDRTQTSEQGQDLQSLERRNNNNRPPEIESIGSCHITKGYLDEQLRAQYLHDRRMEVANWTPIRSFKAMRCRPLPIRSNNYSFRHQETPRTRGIWEGRTWAWRSWRSNRWKMNWERRGAQPRRRISSSRHSEISIQYSQPQKGKTSPWKPKVLNPETSKPSTQATTVLSQQLHPTNHSVGRRGKICGIRASRGWFLRLEATRISKSGSSSSTDISRNGRRRLEIGDI